MIYNIVMIGKNKIFQLNIKTSERKLISFGGDNGILYCISYFKSKICVLVQT